VQTCRPVVCAPRSASQPFSGAGPCMVSRWKSGDEISSRVGEFAVSCLRTSSAMRATSDNSLKVLDRPAPRRNL
jgi:hypothetical protein